MHLIRANVEDAKFAESFSEPVNPRWLLIRADDWADMGSPEIVTVTIDPGDRLSGTV